MKTTRKENNINIIPFPNAATRREMLHNFLDRLLITAMGAGVSASILFLVILGY